ncbi:hypothetical protein AB1Y20_009600 [Prymnesium parvum]|uniref:Protein-tyrosine sulfotransferase n=1 Tax=Prymnesium parvum TaxID=97485 RepID=A0AB34K510_PRYPA
MALVALPARYQRFLGCLAYSALMLAAWWLRAAERAPAPPLPLPPRDDDASTSAAALANRTRCPLSPPLPPLSLRWLPAGRPGRVTPFLLLHEPHVGEGWLLRLLRARGAALHVPSDRGKVREAARGWLAALRATPANGSLAARAVGLALTPNALRILNHGIGRAAGGQPAPPRLLLLSRRNRLKHALSRLPRPNGTAAAPRRVPLEQLDAQLRRGERSFGEWRCTAAQLAAAAGGEVLALDYEDLLYHTQRSLARLAAFLGLPASHEPAYATKRTPNSLCVAVANYREVCEAMRGTPWEADLGPHAADCSCDADVAARGGVRLVLAGSHHKTGTLLLERVLQLYAAEVRTPFEKPAFQSCISLQRREAGVCFDEHLSAPKLQQWWSAPSGAAASFGSPLLHIVREPAEVCVSSYQYHLTSTELWLQQPRPGTAGVPYQLYLRRKDRRAGLLFECRRSIRDQIAQQAEAYELTHRDPRVLTVRMEETEADFDGTMASIFTFLFTAAWRSPSPPPPEHGAELNRSLGSTVRRLVALAGRYDVNRHREQLDDGHLSATQRKRELRGILLNESKIARELMRYRTRTGYDAEYSAHCSRYGFKHHVELRQDGVPVRRRQRRRRAML